MCEFVSPDNSEKYDNMQIEFEVTPDESALIVPLQY